MGQPSRHADEESRTRLHIHHQPLNAVYSTIRLGMRGETHDRFLSSRQSGRRTTLASEVAFHGAQLSSRYVSPLLLT